MPLALLSICKEVSFFPLDPKGTTEVSTTHFLETVENMMGSWEIDEGHWFLQLIPLLEIKTRAACTGLDYTRPYHETRGVIQRRFDFSPEGNQWKACTYRHEVVMR